MKKTYRSKICRNLRIGHIEFTNYLYTTDDTYIQSLIENSYSFRNGEVVFEEIKPSTQEFVELVTNQEKDEVSLLTNDERFANDLALKDIKLEGGVDNFVVKRSEATHVMLVMKRDELAEALKSLGVEVPDWVKKTDLLKALSAIRRGEAKPEDIKFTKGGSNDGKRNN